MTKQISKNKRLLIFEKYNGKCAYCGCDLIPNKWHVDHIVPLYRKWTNEELKSYGRVKGTSRIDNLNPSCPTCNISKSTFELKEWKVQLKEKIHRLRRDVTNFRLMEKYNMITINDTEIKFYFESYGKR